MLNFKIASKFFYSNFYTKYSKTINILQKNAFLLQKNTPIICIWSIDKEHFEVVSLKKNKGIIQYRMQLTSKTTNY